jgi:3-isopropylmalate/(R)-2-methylmalate dehydratase large subunit
MGMATTDASVAAATGENWLRVPETVKIELQGKLPPGTMSRDIMFYFMGDKGWDGTQGTWAYQALEFTGEAAKAMSIDSRLALCNLSADAGAKNAIFPPDEVTRKYMEGRARKTPIYHQSDPDAVYADSITLDVSSLEPHIACPHTPDNVKPLSQLLGTKIHVATVSTCANGRLEDLHAAAEILKGRKVHPDVRLVVSPASQRIYGEALEDGTFTVLQKAGAVIGHSSCGPCNGSQLVVLGDDEVCIGTVPRNFIGRLGSKKSYVYSANAQVVAASAIKGSIADPREFL